MCAAYESVVQQEADLLRKNRFSFPPQVVSTSSDISDDCAGSGSPSSLSSSSAVPSGESVSGSGVSEGLLLVHFLQLFSKAFDPSVQGIGLFFHSHYFHHTC